MVSKLDYIQKEMLRIAVYFHDFCEKNNLQYSICGGTLLGAIRHKSFIPWDDDFDVFMPRHDFERFLEIWEDIETINIIKNGDLNYYKLATPAKLHNPHTKVIERGELENGIDKEFIAHGVFIDIFPMDLYPDNFLGKMLNTYVGKINIKKALSQFPMTSLKRKYRIPIKLFSLIPQWLVDFIVSTSISYLKKNKNGKIGYGVESAITNLFIDKSSIYPFKKEYCINGLAFYIPAKPDVYLEHRFGDYMKLPSVENQTSHICKLFINGIEYSNEERKHVG